MCAGVVIATLSIPSIRREKGEGKKSSDYLRLRGEEAEVVARSAPSGVQNHQTIFQRLAFCRKI